MNSDGESQFLNIISKNALLIVHKPTYVLWVEAVVNIKKNYKGHMDKKNKKKLLTCSAILYLLVTSLFKI